jgi:hypothetical protein
MFSSCSIAPPFGWGSQKPPAGVGIDRSHPLARELRFFTAFNEAAGSRVNDLASGNPGSVENAATTNSWKTRPGWFTFDGVDDRLDFPSVADPGTLQQTIAARIVLNAAPSSIQTVWAANSPYTSGIGAGLGVINPGRLYFTAPFATTPLQYWSSATLAPGVPYAVVATWDGVEDMSGVALYINGVRSLMSDFVDPPEDSYMPSNGLWSLGNTVDSSCPFDGSIGWAGWWNRILTPDEIRRLYVEPFCIFENGTPWSNDGPAVLGPYRTADAQPTGAGAVAGNDFRAGATVGQDWHCGTITGQCNG